MDIDDYKRAVIALFRSGNATDEQWDEMAEAVLDASESWDGVRRIDESIVPETESEDD